jgi:peptidylprolyl isomerase
MAETGKPGEAGFDKAQLKRYLVPAGAVAIVVVLVGLVVALSGAVARKMSDGSDGTANDPDLKDLTPGVRYRDVKAGTGDPCPPGAQITMHYTGWLENGEVFDSSREGKPIPAPFQAFLKSGGEGGLIPGWVEGVPGMKVGGIRKLVIKPEKAYGERGMMGKIPGNATIIFEVELVGFTPPPPPPPQVTKMPFDGSNGGVDDPDLKDIGRGLKIRDLKEGSGDPVREGGEVTMHYTGWLENGRQFDSSRRGTPFNAILKPGPKSVIEGWNRGVVGMKPGGVRKLVIPPEMGYGAHGQGSIPGGATLIFEVELVK